jgi:hypothetical protein
MPLAPGGCSRSLPETAGSGTAGTTGAAGMAGAAGSAPCHSVGTGGGQVSVNQCGDGTDNDGDGKIDYDDPECTGPFDNDETSFAYGITDEYDDACKRDCFFDGNSGMGDDLCLWQLKCDPLSTNPRCPYDAQYATLHESECSFTSSQSPTCLDVCVKQTPNGCDCFGCCVVPGVATPVRLAPTCTAADFTDASKCPPCTQVTQCANPCERCEVCVGKPTLPDDCRTPDGCALYECPNGALACGLYGIEPARCPSGTSCITGCCLPSGF